MASKKPHQMKTNKWCITMWLTDGRTIDTLNEYVQAMPTNWAIEGQIEQGHSTDDKLHAQLFLKTEQTRGTKVAKYFPNCYLDEAKNPFALKNYVHKKDTRVAEFKSVENRSPQWSVVSDRFFEWILQQRPRAIGVIDDDERMGYWDEFIGLSIQEGMRVDLVGVNPQYRSCVMRYWTSYLIAAEARLSTNTSVDKKTDKTEPPVAEGGVVPASNSKKTLRAIVSKE